MKKFLKKFTVASSFVAVAFTFSGCSVIKSALGTLDIAGGLKEALIQGITKGGNNSGGLFSSSNILGSVLGNDAAKVLNTLSTLGLASDVTKFTDNLTKAAGNAAAKSVPVLISGVKSINFSDALSILKGGYNAATNYLRTNVGDSLTQAIKPEVGSVLDQYHINDGLKNLLAKSPVPGLGKNLNLDMNQIVAKMVANKMFDEVEKEEKVIRTDIGARTTDLMKAVFSSPDAYKGQ